MSREDELRRALYEAKKPPTHHYLGILVAVLFVILIFTLAFSARQVAPALIGAGPAPTVITNAADAQVTANAINNRTSSAQSNLDALLNRIQNYGSGAGTS